MRRPAFAQGRSEKATVATDATEYAFQRSHRLDEALIYHYFLDVRFDQALRRPGGVATKTNRNYLDTFVILLNADVHEILSIPLGAIRRNKGARSRKRQILPVLQLIYVASFMKPSGTPMRRRHKRQGANFRCLH